MSPTPVFICLLAMLIFQQVYWTYQVHKLVDKLMSRNYHEYEQAKSPSQPLTAPSVFIPENPEDLGTLGDFRPL